MANTGIECPVDEPKVSVKWTKGSDFMDGSPRYTFEGRDPQDTYERFQVVIYTERERRYSHILKASGAPIMGMSGTTKRSALIR